MTSQSISQCWYEYAQYGSNPRSIYVSGRYVYTVNQESSSTVSIIDISNPSSPVQVGTSTLNSGTSPVSLFVAGRYAYIANSGGSTVSIMMSQISSSRASCWACVECSSIPRSIFVSGRYAYTANYNNAVSIIDVSNSISVQVGTSTACRFRGICCFCLRRYAYSAIATVLRFAIDIHGVRRTASSLTPPSLSSRC